ncbi:MAG: hypothetical protein AAF927_11130 [Bacteroidota bacterium]
MHTRGAVQALLHQPLESLVMGFAYFQLQLSDLSGEIYIESI